MTVFPENDPAWRAYTEHVLNEMLPKLVDSSIAISLMPKPNDVQKGDVKYWTELGAMIMHNKPIIVVAAPGQDIPPALRRVASEVVQIDITSEDGSQRMSEAIAVVMERVRREGSP